MITVKTMKQVATSRVIPSFRSTAALNQRSSAALDQKRIVAGCTQMIDQEMLRQWRNQMWHNCRTAGIQQPVRRSC